MQLQKNLQQSIRKCHQRRLEKICSIKKRLSSFVRTPNPENNIPSKILSEIDNQPEFQQKTLPYKIKYTKMKPNIQEIDSQREHEQLMNQIRENKLQLQNAKKDIETLERHMNEIEEDLIDKQQQINSLKLKNNRLEQVIKELDEKLQNEKIIVGNRQRELEQVRQKIDLFNRELDQNVELIKSMANKNQEQQQLSNQINILNQKLKQRVQELKEQKQTMADQINELNKDIQQTQQTLQLKHQLYNTLLGQYDNLQKDHKLLISENQQYRTRIQELQKQKTVSDSQFYSTKTSNIKYQLQICQLQSKVSDLEEIVSLAEKEKREVVKSKEQLQMKWESVVQTPIHINADNYCCQHELKFKYIELLLELISSSTESSLELLLSVEPSLYNSLKHIIERNTIKHNGSIFSLSSSFHRILGSYQQIAKISQNNISEFIQQQDQNDNSSPEQQQINHEELLARMEQEVQNMSSSHGINHTDVSQLKQNYNAIKMINEQLFIEVESKQKQLKSMSEKLKFYQNYSGVIDHLKANIGILSKEIKSPNQKVSAMLDNIRSLLGL